ncbi:Processing alpha glucosidase I [Elasticomyces elasticus]|nr:Processing alpha glucosidase I [Elasticomyces elasticus]
MQLHMGEGKTSMIVPMSATALTDGTHLVRIIVAKPQSKQMAQMLTAKPGGLVDHRVYHMPISLRSLSTKDEYYGLGEDYWRSPIWVNMNHLVLVRLLALAEEDDSPHRSRARQLYTELRGNIVNTVAESWKQTGFAWEQYNAETGQGQRMQQFTGWTSLIVRIMPMPQLEKQESHPYLYRKLSIVNSVRVFSGGALLFMITMAVIATFGS